MILQVHNWYWFIYWKFCTTFAHIFAINYPKSPACNSSNAFSIILKDAYDYSGVGIDLISTVPGRFPIPVRSSEENLLYQTSSRLRNTVSGPCAKCLEHRSWFHRSVSSSSVMHRSRLRQSEKEKTCWNFESTPLSRSSVHSLISSDYLIVRR